MSSALVNRMVHVHLLASPRDWLEWARHSGIHSWVLEYIALRPDHLTAAPPKHEEPFSTPRSWHMLSDALHSYGDDIDDDDLFVLASGCLSPPHAGQFRAFVKQMRHSWDLEAVLKSTLRWPSDPADRDVLFFLAQSLRARLAKELPRDRRGARSSSIRRGAARRPSGHGSSPIAFFTLGSATSTPAPPQAGSTGPTTSPPASPSTGSSSP